MKIKQMQDLASEIVGDNNKVNLFFVSYEPVGTALISRSFEVAYDYWKSLPRSSEATLEDRQTGVLASYDRENEDGTGRIIVHDSTHMLAVRA
jgi:hypothetical protein